MWYDENISADTLLTSYSLPKNISYILQLFSGKGSIKNCMNLTENTICMKILTFNGCS